MRLAIALLLQASCRASSWSSVEGSRWLRSATPPWQPHTGSIAIPLSNGSVVMMGGQAGEHGGALFDCFNCTNEVWTFHPSEESWMNLSANVPWDPRWGHSAVKTEDDTVWLLFGCCERGKPTVMLRDVWTFNPAKGTPWKKMETAPPFEGVQATSVAVLGKDLWVVGGWSQHRGTLSMVAVLSTSTLAWTEKSKHGEAPWKHRADHATAISPDGRWLLLFAGQHRDARTGNWFRLQDTWRVELPSAAATAWEQLSDLTGARSSPAVAVLPSGWLLLLGGHWVKDDEELKAKQADVEGMIEHHRKERFTVYGDVQALDLKNGGKSGWKAVEPEAAWPARDDCAGLATSEGSVLLFGGGTQYGGGGYLQDVWMLQDPETEYKLSSMDQAKSDEL